MATSLEMLARVVAIVEHFGDATVVAKVQRALADLDPESPVRSDPFTDTDGSVRALFEHDARTVTAWVLVAATEQVDAIGNVEHAIDYTSAPGTAVVLALGLADALQVELRRIVHSAFDGSA